MKQRTKEQVYLCVFMLRFDEEWTDMDTYDWTKATAMETDD